ncbi:MAG: cysteine--tRNA ligase [Candidatus Shapirobacteria bacterium]|jgi:cysteinyl-tRNA synthetase
MQYFYNTASGQKETFKPIENNVVKIYSCGPTIYDFPHIGNLSTYLFIDLLKRYLRFSGYTVKDVMNFTDVDDKTIRASREKGIPLKEYTEKYGQAFLADFERLNILKPQIICKATEHIKEMLELIKILADKGFAYKAEDGSIYFRISKFGDYGKFAGINKRELKGGGSGRMKTDEYEKDNASDFVLWKAWDEKDGDVYWESEFGKGRPGWHIECSAMSMKYLGPNFDIHTGAIDLIFPHHQNEIAQSEAATGKKFVNYWLHRGFLKVNDQKMGKSLGNMYILDQVLEKVADPIAFRYLVLTSHYRQPLNFTFEGLTSADNALKKLRNWTSRIVDARGEEYDSPENILAVEAEIRMALAEFQKYLDDDLNTPQAIAGLFNTVNNTNRLVDSKKIGPKAAEKILDFVRKVDEVWAFDLLKTEKVDEITSQRVEKLIEQRDGLRKDKKWQEADRLKTQLQEMGIEIKDTPEGTSWKKA